MNREYSLEMRERALRMLAETRPSHPTMMSAVRHVAGLLGMSPETLRLWQRRAEVGAGVKPGLTTDAAAEIKRLHAENYGVYGRWKMHALGVVELKRSGDRVKDLW